MSNIKIIPLGAGQEVGRSCIYVIIDDKLKILFDTGVHMSISDIKKYPDFQYLIDKYQAKTINDVIDCVFISHFHLDHCAALPVLTETYNYTGPIYTSSPTKKIIPFMLYDYLKV